MTLVTSLNNVAFRAGAIPEVDKCACNIGGCRARDAQVGVSPLSCIETTHVETTNETG